LYERSFEPAKSNRDNTLLAAVVVAEIDIVVVIVIVVLGLTKTATRAAAMAMPRRRAAITDPIIHKHEHGQQ